MDRCIEESFFEKVVELESGCWEWTAGRSHNGYGVFRSRQAHRWSYEFMVAEIPPGLQLDHLCRNKSCVNPWHLEPVTPAENSRRRASEQLTCNRGRHPRSMCSTDRRGFRKCRGCANEAMTRWRNANRDHYNTYQAEYRARNRGQ